ncbi:SDR family NAD(P)-dependent oxidoreductase [Microbacterium sp. ZW T5_56]|uniref:SDR family NAD(P)-dependent oxidoreductase n=1 Tax=Microbacterium sp. ZW T5_56 TaxID=3378081 RepID=UPI0038550606
MTGASGGIGAHICETLSLEGYAVVAQFASNRRRVDELARVLRLRGGACLPVEADLTTSAGIDGVVAAVSGQLVASPGARLLALVNNAACMQGPSFSTATLEAFDRFVALNVRAPFLLTQALSNVMCAGASIVNISSASAHIASGSDPIYAMTKAALESLTRNLAIELGPRGIRVNGVIPGYTDNGNALFRDPRARKYMGAMSVLGGVASPSAVADAVQFLVSDRAARTTGTFLDVSGGMTLHPRASANGGVRDAAQIPSDS